MACLDGHPHAWEFVGYVDDPWQEVWFCPGCTSKAYRWPKKGA